MERGKRFIDAEPICDKCGLRGYYNCTLCKVGTAPTVDAVEVVHGRWEKNWSGDNIVYCDQCYMPQDMPTPYCHSCGAKMDAIEQILGTGHSESVLNIRKERQ